MLNVLKPRSKIGSPAESWKLSSTPKCTPIHPRRRFSRSARWWAFGWSSPVGPWPSPWLPYGWRSASRWKCLPVLATDCWDATGTGLEAWEWIGGHRSWAEQRRESKGSPLTYTETMWKGFNPATQENRSKFATWIQPRPNFIHCWVFFWQQLGSNLAGWWFQTTWWWAAWVVTMWWTTWPIFIAGCFLASKTLAPVMLAVAVMVDDGWLKLKNTIREFWASWTYFQICEPVG